MADVHPLVHALFAELPPPETRWVAEDRVKWLRAVAQCFGLIYLGDADLHIVAAAAPVTTDDAARPSP